MKDTPITIEERKTLLVIAPGRDATIRNAGFNLLVAETGEHLASHFCSNYGFAPSDLYYGRPERIEQFKERFGEVEIMFIDETDIPEIGLVRRNEAWYNEAKRNEQQLEQ